MTDGDHAWPPDRIGLAVAAAVVILGSFAPWATVGVIDIAGTKGDGLYTAIAGLVAVVLVLGEIYWPVVAVGVGVAAVAVLEVRSVQDYADDVDAVGIEAAVGYGLWLVVIAAALMSAMALRKARG